MNGRSQKEKKPYKLGAKLIGSTVDSAVRTPSNFFHDNILVDAVICPSVSLITGELNTSIQSFLFERHRLGSGFITDT